MRRGEGEHGTDPRPGEYSIGNIIKGYAALFAARALGRSGEPGSAGQPAGRDGGGPGTADEGRLGGEAGSASRPRAGHQQPGPERSGSASTERTPEELRQRARAEQSDAAPSAQAPQGVWPITKFVFKEFGRDNGSLMAAAVAFYLLLSLIPLVLLAISVFGFAIEQGRAQTTVIGFLGTFLPGTGGQKLIEEIIQGAMEVRGSVGIAGLAGLAITATAGFSTLETAINVMWSQPNRSFIMNKLMALFMMLVVGVLLVLSLGVTTVTGWAMHIPGLDWLARNGLLKVLGYVLPVAISGLMFTIIFRVYPTGRSGWKPALTAGFITALLWEIFKVGYTFYTQFQGDQRATYGALAGVVGLVIWIYYSSILVLLGSELCWVLEGCPGREAKEAAHALTGRDEHGADLRSGQRTS